MWHIHWGSYYSHVTVWNSRRNSDLLLGLLYTPQFPGFLNWNNPYILHVMITSINSQSPWSLGRWDIAGKSHLWNKTEILVLESSSSLLPDSLYYFKSELSDFLIENSEKALGSLCSSWHNRFFILTQWMRVSIVIVVNTTPLYLSLRKMIPNA